MDVQQVLAYDGVLEGVVTCLDQAYSNMPATSHS